MKFKSASLFYGKSKYTVENDDRHPIGDFNPEGDLMEQVFHVMSCMSNAAGGHHLHRAILHVHPNFVTLIGDGFTVSWGDPSCYDSTKTPKENARIIDEWFAQIVEHKVPFSVRADQYGEGWKRGQKC